MAGLNAALNAEAKGRVAGLYGEGASEERWGKGEKQMIWEGEGDDAVVFADCGHLCGYHRGGAAR